MIAIRILFDLFERLSGVMDQDLIQEMGYLG
jgi:hypothetical protein